LLLFVFCDGSEPEDAVRRAPIAGTENVGEKHEQQHQAALGDIEPGVVETRTQRTNDLQRLGAAAIA
jgi:hypothetical protein